MEALSRSLPFDYKAAEQEIPPLRQDIYAVSDGYRLPMNIYAPAVKNENAKTAVLCIHGGGWTSKLQRDIPFSGDWMRHNARYFASRGFYALEITYRSIGRDDEPPTGVCLADIVSDVYAAMAYIKNTLQKELGFEKIAVIGDSAGGHLSLCLALAEDEALHPDAVIACNPVSNCVDDPRWHGKLQDESERCIVSPLHQAKKTGTRILLMHGDADTVVPLSDSQALYAALTAKGTDVTLTVLSGEAHAFIIFGYNPDTAAVTRSMERAFAFLSSL